MASTTLQKLIMLADAAKYDASCASSGGTRRNSRDQQGLGSNKGMGICHSYAPDGRCISLLKILLTNWCQYDCLYCVNRVSSNVERARFSVAEVVALTLDFYRRNVIEGLFLSSGIIQSPDYTMEQLVEVARSLREDEHFRGYIHLKTIPDASPELLARAGRYADRLSINIELPTQQTLEALAPQKDAVGIKKSMARIRLALDESKEQRAQARQTRALPGAAAKPAAPPRFAPAGQSTQMIVGADASDDRSILKSSVTLYRNYRLKRVYYSAFSPIPHASAALPARAAPLMREHRLYQADWLMRFYGFEEGELVTEGGMLSLQVDPKMAWALAHPEQFPVDVNAAEREMLLRVPGLGVQSVDRLLAARRVRRLRKADIQRLGSGSGRALAFLRLPDHRPTPADLAALLNRSAERAQRKGVVASEQTDLFAAEPASEGAAGEDAAPGRSSAVEPPGPVPVEAVTPVLEGPVTEQAAFDFGTPHPQAQSLTRCDADVAAFPTAVAASSPGVAAPSAQALTGQTRCEARALWLPAEGAHRRPPAPQPPRRPPTRPAAAAVGHEAFCLQPADALLP